MRETHLARICDHALAALFVSGIALGAHLLHLRLELLCLGLCLLQRLLLLDRLRWPWSVE